MLLVAELINVSLHRFKPLVLPLPMYVSLLISYPLRGGSLYHEDS